MLPKIDNREKHPFFCTPRPPPPICLGYSAELPEEDLFEEIPAGATGSGGKVAKEDTIEDLHFQLKK